MTVERRYGIRAWHLLLFLVLAFACLTGCRSPRQQRRSRPVPASASADGPLAGVTVVLDPGHGGEDSGAICSGVREDAVNYRMAATIASLLHGQGATVVYTVESAALNRTLSDHPVEPPLAAPNDARLSISHAPLRLRKSESPENLYCRAAVARNVWEAQKQNGRQGTYFLSLHCDALSSHRWHGARVYCDARQTQPCRLAVVLKRRLTEAGFTYTQGGSPIPRLYGVLNPHYNPIPQRVLIEVATISSARDRDAVQAPAWRWRVAGLIVDAIKESHAEPETAAP